MKQFERHFSLEEARRQLPWLREQLQRLQSAIGDLENARENAEPVVSHFDGNGGGPPASRYLSHHAVVLELLTVIQDKGIQIKDPRRGLVDFPHIRNTEEVFLCYLLGENDINFWHDLEGGFAKRRPL
jgi:hypothetical protein